MTALANYNECKQKIEDSLMQLRERLYKVMALRAFDLQLLSFEAGICWATAYNFLVLHKRIKNCTLRKLELFLQKYEDHGQA